MVPLPLKSEHIMALSKCIADYVGNVGTNLLDIVTRNVSNLTALLLAVNEQPVVILPIHV